jgi:hypothetical protein
MTGTLGIRTLPGAVAAAALSAALAAGCVYDYDAPFRCSNGVKDGDETDVDCGGGCGPCARTKACAKDADCASPLVCQANACGFTPVPIWVAINSVDPKNPSQPKHPSGRYGAAMAPAGDGSLLLFGGLQAGTTLADNATWRLVDQQWSVAVPASADPPSSRYAPGMAFDAGLPATVLFGGEQGSTGFVDTYSWTGSGWKQEQDAAAGGRWYMAMAFDPGTSQTFVFGGFSTGAGTLDDFMFRPSKAGAAWSKPTQANGAPLPPRDSFAGAFDSLRKRLVVFGGHDGDGMRGDTREFDVASRAWVSAATLTGGPSKREHAAMAYDEERRVVVLYGGEDFGGRFDETWEYRVETSATKGSWTKVPIEQSPGPRERASMAYDQGGHRIVLFGGNGPGGLLSDTWAYALVGNACAADSDCGTRACEDGVCCERRCDSGQACDTPDNPGRCVTPAP